ncbi:hypothetical protein EON65_57360, partial [archaeon]
MPNKDAPRLIWTLSENDVDFSDLQPDQLINHFEGIHQLTTKQGFADIVRDAAQVSADPAALSLRTYNLGDPVQREEFIDDFRLSAAANILKLFLSNRNSSILNPSNYTRLAQFQTMNSEILRCCVYVLTWHIRVYVYGEWPGVDISKTFKDKDYPLEDNQWQDILDFSYELAQLNREEEWVMQSHIMHALPYTQQQRTILHTHYTPLDHKVSSLLRLYATINPQYVAEGYKNIWIVKSPDSSCGKGIKLCYLLQSVLGLERQMAGRTVQKYLEAPLLLKSIKFDLRIWVLLLGVASG